MGSQDEDYYSNLSRKELQGLCKKYGLPANKPSSQLAELLMSFLEGKDGRLSHTQEEWSTDSEDVLPSTLPKSDLNLEAPLNSLVETSKVRKRRLEVSNTDHGGPSSCSKGKGGSEKIHPRAGNRGHINSHVQAQPMDKLSDTSGNLVHTDPVNDVTKECLHCSTFNPGNKDTAVTMPQLQAMTASMQFHSGQNESGVKNRNESLNSVQLKNFNSHSLNPPSNCEIGSMPLIQCRSIAAGIHPAESGVLSSSDVSMKACPASFQFFVNSEEGVNLYVDLNSSPSDWVRSLRDKVSMYRKVHWSKSHVLRRELGCLGERDECMKTSLVGCPEKSLQTKQIERNVSSTCLRSSLSLLDGDNSHCGAYCQDAPNEPLRSLMRTSSSHPLAMSGHSDEDKWVCLSPFEKPDSNVYNDPSTVSTCTLAQSSVAAASKMTTHLDGIPCPDLSECWTSKSNSIFHENAEARFVGISNMVSSVLDKSNLLLSGESHEGLSSHNIGFEKNSEDTSISPRLFGAQPELVSAMDGMQSVEERSAGWQHGERRCAGHGGPDVGDSTSAFTEEQGRGTVVNETESSDCLQSENLLHTSKRTNESEFVEELQSKGQCSGGENPDCGISNSAKRTLRSAKNMTKEHPPPRRSKRLEHKSKAGGFDGDQHVTDWQQAVQSFETVEENSMFTESDEP